jgi:DegV family protein with EDD domain
MRRLVQAFNRHEVASVVGDLDPEVAFQDYPVLPDAGWNQGIQGVEQWSAKWLSVVPDAQIEVSDFLEAGPRFLYSWRIFGHGRHSGADETMAGFGVGTLRGKRLVRLELYVDRDEALDALETDAARPVAVVTDSTSYLPGEVVDSLGIQVVSLYWDLGDGHARETDSGDDYGEFYAALEAAATVAKTSPPTVEDFIAVYEPLLADGRDVVSIHISRGLSETCTNAEMAAGQLATGGNEGDRITVLDSAGGGAQLGLVAMAAAHAARRGSDAAAVAEVTKGARQEARTWFLLDTLEYLRRGGRLGGAIAWVGSTLNIKPILEAATELRAVERVRTRARGTERLVEFGRQQVALGADAWCVQHSRALDDANQLVERMRAVFARPPEFVAEVGPVFGTHLGPGVVGIGTMPARFLEPIAP